MRRDECLAPTEGEPETPRMDEHLGDSPTRVKAAELQWSLSGMCFTFRGYDIHLSKSSRRVNMGYKSNAVS